MLCTRRFVFPDVSCKILYPLPVSGHMEGKTRNLLLWGKSPWGVSTKCFSIQSSRGFATRSLDTIELN